jgi:hypothetical protein
MEMSVRLWILLLKCNISMRFGVILGENPFFSVLKITTHVMEGLLIFCRMTGTLYCPTAY